MKSRLIVALASITALGGCVSGQADAYKSEFPVVETLAFETVKASGGTLLNRIEGANWMCAYVMHETEDQEGEDYFNNENILVLDKIETRAKSLAGAQFVSYDMPSVTQQDAYSSFDSFFDGSERRNQLFLDIWDECDSLRASI